MDEERKRKAFSAGRWAVERERHHITDEEPPTRHHEPDTLAGLLPGLMKRLGLEVQHWLGVLDEEWPKLVGVALAKHTRPGRMDKRNLTVFVDSSVWLNELSRYGKTQMLENLQARFGRDKIESVHLQLDPDGGRPARDANGLLRKT